MIRVALVSLGLVVLAANQSTATDVLMLAVAAFAVFVVGALLVVGEAMR